MLPPVETVAEAYVAEARRQIAKAAGVVQHCLGQLTDEQLSWRPQKPMNSIGNLVLHLCGNVRQWIVSGVGGAADLRNRPQEFAQSGPFEREELLRQLGEVVRRADEVLEAVSPPQLLQRRRIQGFDTTGLSAIFDSVAHFKGHTQEIVCLTRWQLGPAYRFQWAPSTPEEGASPTSS
jgi:hypothetical protein